MSRPDDIPQDVWDIAIAIETGYEGGTGGRRPAMIARAIMAVSSIHEAETPVAWHTTDIRGRIAETTDFPSVADAWCEQGYTVRPLFAHPAPISKGVTVKALSWEKHNVDGTVWTSEVSVTGEYLVKFNGKTWEASVRMLMIGREYAGSEAAKTACQDHHAGRILSCLSHTAGEPPCHE